MTKNIVYLAIATTLAITVCCRNRAQDTETHISHNDTIHADTFLQRDTLVKRLTLAGELEISGDNPGEVHAYFDTAAFRFHGPDGFEAGYAGLNGYFSSLRHAFDDRTIQRGIIVQEGNYLACQTTISGKFVRPFTQSPAGTIPPNGQQVVFNLMNIFRFDERGRITEEWVQIDNRSLLRQLTASNRRDR